MSTHAKIFLVFCTVVSLALGQQVAVKTGDQHALILPGKVALEWYFSDTSGTWDKDVKPETRVWLSIETANHKTFQQEGFNPSYCAIFVKDAVPVVRKLGENRYEIGFRSEIAKDLP